MRAQEGIKANPDTGSGLAIARGLIELHDCEIDVESRLGHNSTFRFTLPRS